MRKATFLRWFCTLLTRVWFNFNTTMVIIIIQYKPHPARRRPATAEMASVSRRTIRKRFLQRRGISRTGKHSEISFYLSSPSTTTDNCQQTHCRRPSSLCTNTAYHPQSTQSTRLQVPMPVPPGPPSRPHQRKKTHGMHGRALAGPIVCHGRNKCKCS